MLKAYIQTVFPKDINCSIAISLRILYLKAHQSPHPYYSD